MGDLDPFTGLLKPMNPQFRNLQTERSLKSLSNFLGVYKCSEAHPWCGERNEVFRQHSGGHQDFQVVKGKPSEMAEKELLGLGWGQDEKSERMIVFSCMKNKVIDNVKELRLRLGLGQRQRKLEFNRVEHRKQ